MQLRSHTHSPTPFTLHRGILFALLIGVILSAGFVYAHMTQPEQPQFEVDHSHTLPIVSLELPDTTTAELETVESKEWEKTGNLFYYEENGKLGFQTSVEIELHGRNLLTHPQKSFQIEVINEDRRTDSVTYPLFGADAPQQHSHLVLRNDEASGARLREQVGLTLARQGSKLDIQQGHPVIVYINGDYWGLYFLRQKLNREFFSDKYGVPADTIGITEISIESDPKDKALPGAPGSQKDADDFNTLLQDSAACSTCLSYYWAQKRLDGHILIDYLIFELYVANFDWPYNNYKAWRYQTPIDNPPESELVPELDGRFRWMFYDLDVAFGSQKTDAEAMIGAAQGDPYGQIMTNIFPLRNLFNDQYFLREYQERVNELLETTLSAENASAVVRAEAARIRPEMPRQIERWQGYEQDGEPAGVQSMDQWETYVDALEVYVQTRPQYFQKYTDEFVHEQLQK